MKLIEYFKLITRNKFTIILCILVCLGIAKYFADQKTTKPYNSSIFITFSLQKTSNSSSNENLQSSDQLTETIQGWFKDPAFIEEISQKSTIRETINAKKQEKNNLLISYESNSLQSAEKHQSAIIQSLENRLSTYNQHSDFQVKIAVNSPLHQENSNSGNLFILLGGIIGLITGITLSYFFELMTDKIITSSSLGEEPVYENKDQLSVIIENTLEKPQYIKLFKDKIKHEELKFLNIKEKEIIDLEIEAKSIKSTDSVILVKLGTTTNNQFKTAKILSQKKHLTVLF